jgi:hypothetical protein
VGFVGKVAEAGLERVEVYPEVEFYFGRDGVCARGLLCTFDVLYVPSGLEDGVQEHGRMCNHSW